MKTLLTLVMLLTVPASAAWQGKLDLLSPQASAIGVRELHDGNWLAGLQTKTWHLEKDGLEVFSVSYFQAWRAMQGDPAYGLSVGVKAASASGILQSVVSSLDNNGLASWTPPPWVKSIGNWVSLDIYGGFRPTHSADVHSWVYGIGGKVTSPLDLSCHKYSADGSKCLDGGL